MLSPRNRKLRYLRDRSANAYLLLRQGNFRQFLVHLKSEVDIQFESVRSRINDYAEVSVQSRLGFDSQEAATGSRIKVADLDSEYIDRRKVQPPSYRPTNLKRVAPVNMKADTEAVKSELRAILSSFNVRKRR